MKDFKKLPKMACGGGVKKYSGEDGSYVVKDEILEASKPKKYVDRMPMPKRNDGTNPTLSKIVGAPENTKYVDRMPMPEPSDTVNIPGVGPMKKAAPKFRGDAMLLKKGGRATKKVGTVKKNK